MMKDPNMTAELANPKGESKTGLLSSLKNGYHSISRTKRRVIVFLTALILAAILAILLGILIPRSKASKEPALTVDLGYERYRGRSVTRGVNRWLGIRYAAPPVGDLRFRAPQDPVINHNDTSVKTADKHGPICLPTPSSNLSKTSSEDCLFLDIYAPSRGRNHPVHVLFQGGGFNTNSNPNTNGTSVIIAGDYDIVVVTFNYRVGPWGFLTSEEVQRDGDLNVGLLDQRKLLHWVQQYIHLFGGDPGHVTIGGASAGGASVDLHLSAYDGRDDGLFHAAAAESQSFAAQMTVQESQYQYDGLVARVGCGNATDTLKCLRSIDVKVIAENNINLPTPGGGGGEPNFMYTTVLDGNFSTDYTYKLYSEGKFVKVPVIFGDVTNEGTIFTPKNISNYTAMNSFLKDNWANLNDSQLETIDQLYPKAEDFPKAGAYWRTASNAYGEMRYICPGIYISGMYNKYGVNASYNYRWDVLDPDNAVSGLGVRHTAEFASIWGTSSPPDSALIQTIQGYWTSFIRSKDPNRYRLHGSPTWEAFDPETQQRIHFPNNVSEVGMESVPADQRVRCAYATSIGVSMAQ